MSQIDDMDAAQGRDAAQFAATFLSEVVMPLQKKVTETFGTIIKKAHEAHKAALTERNTHLRPLEEIERDVKGALVRYRARLEEWQNNQPAIEDCEYRVVLDSEGMPEVSVPMPQVQTPAPLSGVQFRSRYQFDIVSEDEITREFLMPDHHRIRKVIAEYGKYAEKIVGGIEVYEDISVAAKAS